MTDSILSLSLLVYYEDGGRNHLLNFRIYKSTWRRLQENNKARRNAVGSSTFPTERTVHGSPPTWTKSQHQDT